MLPCDRANTTSYWRSIVTVSLSRVVSEIFSVEKCCDLEIWIRGQVTQGHWKWYYSIDCVGFLLVFFSNFVPKTHRFWGSQLQNCSYLENHIRDLSRSLEISPFDNNNNNNNNNNNTHFIRPLTNVTKVRAVTQIPWPVYICIGMVFLSIRTKTISASDRVHMTSYWRSIVTMALSRVVSETFNVEKCRDSWPWNRGQKSLKWYHSIDCVWFPISVL